jgi:hypothetical protein
MAEAAAGRPPPLSAAVGAPSPARWRARLERRWPRDPPEASGPSAVRSVRARPGLTGCLPPAVPGAVSRRDPIAVASRPVVPPGRRACPARSTEARGVARRREHSPEAPCSMESTRTSGGGSPGSRPQGARPAREVARRGRGPPAARERATMQWPRTAARAVDRQGCGSPSTPKAQPEGGRHRAPRAASSARTGDNNGCAVLVAAPARDLTRLSGSTRGTRRRARPDTSLRGSSRLRTRGSDGNASPGSATPHARSRGDNPGSRHTEGSPTPAGVSGSRR